MNGPTHSTPEKRTDGESDNSAKQIERILAWHEKMSEQLERDKKVLLAKTRDAIPEEGADLPFLRGRVTATDELLTSFAQVAMNRPEIEESPDPDYFPHQG